MWILRPGPPPPTGAAARPFGALHACGPGVLLCWRAPSLPRIRYKILPARLLGGDNGIKLSLHVEKAPNRAISGEQGEFYTGNAARAGMQGEFCTEAARRGSCWARFVSPWHLMVCAVAGLSPPTGAPSWPSAPAARSTLVAVGVLRHAKRCVGVSPACRSSNDAIPPPLGGSAGTVRGGMAPKTQTTSPKNGGKALLGAKWSAFWAVPGGMGCSRTLSGAWTGW